MLTLLDTPNWEIFSITSFDPRIKEGPLSVLGFNFMYIQYRQDAGIRTRDAATAARCATNELHTFLNKLDTSLMRYIHP